MTEPLDPNRGAAPDAAPSEAPTAEQVKLALRKVKDPELNLNIIDLGLVYDVMVEDRTALRRSVVKARRPSSLLRRTISSRPGS